jgi:hypothetical protein
MFSHSSLRLNGAPGSVSVGWKFCGRAALAAGAARQARGKEGSGACFYFIRLKWSFPASSHDLEDPAEAFVPIHSTPRQGASLRMTKLVVGGRGLRMTKLVEGGRWLRLTI